MFLLLIGAAGLIAIRFGFIGLLLLGAMTWLVCVRAELDQDVPAWGTQLFRTRMGQGGSPEQRAALHEEREGHRSPLRFYGRCGMALVAAGGIGVLWQAWS